MNCFSSFFSRIYSSLLFLFRIYSTFEFIPENRLEDVLQSFEEFSEYHPKDAWYLAFIAVDPSQQGSGIGSFILKEALKMIDEKNEKAYLEASSERNMSLYERHGFECLGRIQINDSPPAFPMIRQKKNDFKKNLRRSSS